MINRILIYDDIDGFFDAYFFDTFVNEEEVEKTIIEVKKKLEGEWTLDDIKNAICEKFSVREVVLFGNTGFGTCSTVEVNKLEVK